MVTTLNSVASTAGVNVNGLAPVFTGASVNGNSLVISYFAATSLDSINIPDLSAYHVTADGAANAVTAIVIDSAAKLQPHPCNSSDCRPGSYHRLYRPHIG